MAAKRRIGKVTRRAPIGTDANAEPRNRRGRTDAPATPLGIRVQGVVVDDALRDYIATRAGFKLGKFAGRIDRITVRLEDVSGPIGAPACRCAVKIVLARHESILVQIVDPVPRAAFDLAIASTQVAVRRALERARGNARRL